jgi:hypothetical protein
VSLSVLRSVTIADQTRRSAQAGVFEQMVHDLRMLIEPVGDAEPATYT